MTWVGTLWRNADWQAVGTVVALLGVLVSMILAIRGQRQDRRIAENTAKRAEHAAELSDANTRRVIDALETIAGRINAGEPAREPRVAWSMHHHEGDRYILTNVGDALARAVKLSGDESLRGPERFQGGPDVPPGEVVTFIAVRTMATTDSTIAVSWTTDGESDTRTWRYPLPARPPRGSRH